MKKCLLTFFVFVLLGCSAEADNKLTINDSHLDYLYREINVNGSEMAVINIYSNYPDYNYVGDDDEGFACVDDAARAAIYYLRNGIQNNDPESIRKNKMLVKFLLYMQSDNGYFYNFIWDDYSINKDYKTSVAQPNWWSWRALWTLTESYNYYKDKDAEFSKSLFASIEELISKVKENIPSENNFDIEAGIKIPAWLPVKYAADQASVLLIGLTEYYKDSKDEIIFNYIKQLCEGIIAMQIVDKTSKFNGAFFSWMNYWHAYGNLQSYALLKSYEILKDEKLLNAALNELNGFYNALIEEGFLSSFQAVKNEEGIKTIEVKKFSQIAYNIRPMVYALMEAYKVTNDEKYAEKAGIAASWFIGNNAAGINIYNPDTGIIYDGINSKSEVNKNSGAESTIEALLSLLQIEKNKTAVEAFSIK